MLKNNNNFMIPTYNIHLFYITIKSLKSLAVYFFFSATRYNNASQEEYLQAKFMFEQIILPIVFYFLEWSK